MNKLSKLALASIVGGLLLFATGCASDCESSCDAKKAKCESTKKCDKDAKKCDSKKECDKDAKKK